MVPSFLSATITLQSSLSKLIATFTWNYSNFLLCFQYLTLPISLSTFLSINVTTLVLQAQIILFSSSFKFFMSAKPSFKICAFLLRFSFLLFPSELMDVNGFDDYFDLRDQQEENQEMKQPSQAEPQTELAQQVTATKDNEKKGVANGALPNVCSENESSSSWAEGNQMPQDLGEGSSDNIVNVGSSVGTTATPQQPFYFPLGGTDWANVFSTGEISGVSLANLLSAEQLQALTQGDNSSFMPHLTAEETVNPDLSRFIPPQMLMQSSNDSVNDPSAEKEPDKDQNGNSDEVQSNTGTQPANTMQEEDNGRMRTRSSSRQRDQTTKDTSKSTETAAAAAAAATETTKRKSRPKKLYCICQKPYTGEPMVQCDVCKEW